MSDRRVAGVRQAKHATKQPRLMRGLAAITAVLLFGALGQSAALALEGSETEGEQQWVETSTEQQPSPEADTGEIDAPGNAGAGGEPGAGVGAEPDEMNDPGEPASEPEAEEPPQQAIRPFAVPPASGNTAVITVNVGGDRQGNGRSGVAGVVLRLNTGGNASSLTPVAEPWATCVSDAQGDCSFVVPETQPQVRSCIKWGLLELFCKKWRVDQAQGVNYDKRFWVAAEAAPEDWYVNPALETGSGNGVSSHYVFQTGKQLRKGNTYASGSTFMGNDSGGSWAVSRSNPRLQPSCQATLNVALVLDLSGSMGDNKSQGLNTLKASANRMVQALKGTGSSVAIFTYSDTAPASNNADLALTKIDQGQNFQTITNKINSYTAGGGTNWDAGIYRAAESSTTFDLAIMVTDGMPTFYGAGSNSGSGTTTYFIDVERAIFAANALKAKGTRVVAIGAGSGAKGSAGNLRAVSGVSSYSAGSSFNDADYFQSDWQELAAQLEGLALGATCQASVEITKLTKAYGAAEASSGGSGWSFAAAASGAVLKSPAQQNTNAEGKVSYALEFDSPNAVGAEVSVHEEMNATQVSQGWKLAGLSCSINDKPTNPQSLDKATLLVGPGDTVKCTFVNEQTLASSILLEKKAWTAADHKTEIAAGTNVASGTTVHWSYRVTNTGQTTLREVRVEDDQLAFAAVVCPETTLAPGASTTCLASGLVTALP